MRDDQFCWGPEGWRISGLEGGEAGIIFCRGNGSLLCRSNRVLVCVFEILIEAVYGWRDFFFQPKITQGRKK